mmetsp:Transcript_94804/g.274119  ORF Transcript_94804/g.274119 Transcript_94804/m.274119 type:complete len:221 (-) Transcript_94804:614-1276(-)
MVYLDDILDHLRTLAEAQCADGFLLVEVRWRASDDQRCLRIAAKRLLKHTSELGVPVWHVGVLLVRQGVDHIAQRGQGTIDVLGLIEPLARSAGLRDLLAARQVDQMQLAHLDGTIVQILLLNRQHEDEMGPGGVLVHIRDSHGAVVVARPHGVEDLLLVPDVRLRHLADKHAPGLVLVDFQIVSLGIQQVSDTLVVDLHDRYLDQELDVLIRVVDAVED